jgi:archaellum component FlaC
MLSVSGNKRLKALTASGKEENRKNEALEELTERETRIFNKLTWQLREGVYNKATKEDRVEYLEKMYEGLPKKVQKRLMTRSRWLIVGGRRGFKRLIK